jgi:hypothetical protein
MITLARMMKELQSTLSGLWEKTKCIASDSSSSPASGSSTTPTTFAGTKKYYVDWTTFKCVQDCAVGSARCGGFADSWNFLHKSKEQCCRKCVSWDYKEHMK